MPGVIAGAGGSASRSPRAGLRLDPHQSVVRRAARPLILGHDEAYPSAAVAARNQQGSFRPAQVGPICRSNKVNGRSSRTLRGSPDSPKDSPMITHPKSPPAEEWHPAPVPDTTSLARLRAAAANVQACPLYKNATQTVFGEGPADAHSGLRRRATGRSGRSRGTSFRRTRGQTARPRPRRCRRGPPESLRHQCGEAFQMGATRQTAPPPETQRARYCRVQTVARLGIARDPSRSNGPARQHRRPNRARPAGCASCAIAAMSCLPILCPYAHHRSSRRRSSARRMNRNAKGIMPLSSPI